MLFFISIESYDSDSPLGDSDLDADLTVGDSDSDLPVGDSTTTLADDYLIKLHS